MFRCRRYALPAFTFIAVLSFSLYYQLEKYWVVFLQAPASDIRHLANNSTVARNESRISTPTFKQDQDAAAGVNLSAPQKGEISNLQGHNTTIDDSSRIRSAYPQPKPVTDSEAKTHANETATNTADNATSQKFETGGASVADSQPHDEPNDSTTENAETPSPTPRIANNTRTPDTATSAADNTKENTDSRQSESLSKEAKIAAFYQNHYEKMRSIARDRESLLRWFDGGPFRSWMSEFTYIKIKDATTNLEDFNLQDHSFIYLDETKSLCAVAKVFDKFRQNNQNVSWPHVALVHFNPDFGALSSPIKGYTGRFRNGPHYWKGEGCSIEYVLEYVNHPDTLAVITSQFQVIRHKKLISIPLGLSRGSSDFLWSVLHERYNPHDNNRSELLMVNVKPWGQRVEPMKRVLENFNATKDNFDASMKEPPKGLSVSNATEMANLAGNKDTMRNTYQLFRGLRGIASLTLYYEQMMRSKFVWSPSGLGLDCYRTWETLYLGGIPVMAHLGRIEEDGWISETMRDLPIVWVEQHDQITPEFLEQAFEKIVLEPPPDGYKYEKLTKQYWIDLVYSFLDPNSPGRRRYYGSTQKS